MKQVLKVNTRKLSLQAEAQPSRRTLVSLGGRKSQPTHTKGWAFTDFPLGAPRAQQSICTMSIFGSVMASHDRLNCKTLLRRQRILKGHRWYYLQFPQYILKKILVIVTTFNRHIGLCKNAGRFTLWNWPWANAKKCRLDDCNIEK